MTRPLQSEAKADCEAAKEHFNPLRRLAEYRAPTAAEREMTLLNRQATREANKRRRLSRFAHLLCVELRAREIAGAGLHSEERGRLMEVLTEARRALAPK